MEKKISLFLALLMLAGSFASCAESTANEDETQASAEVGSEVTETVPETEERILPNLPDVTYDGA